MAISVSLGSANSNGFEDPEERKSSESDEIWRSGSSITIPAGPSADILSYTFANLGQYDQDKPIFVDALNPSNSLSARQLRTTVRKLIAGFRAHGLQKGDCVCLHAFNSIWYPPIWLAVIGAGGIVFGANPSAPSAELSHHLTTTRARYLITEVASLAVAEQVAAACGISTDHLFALAKTNQPVPAGRQAFLRLLNYGESDWDAASHDEEDISLTTACYCTTSGTTGLPKAAKIPHRYFVAQSAMIEQRLESRPYEPSQLIFLPVFHTFAAPISLLQPLRLGIITYFLPRFDVGDFTEAVETFQITDTAIVPPIVTALLRLPRDYASLNSLRYVLCAGAPIAAALQTKLYHYLSPGATIGQVWGATELGWVTMFAIDEKDYSGSVGTLLPGIEMKLINEDLGPVSTDLEHGEALIRSPSAFTGYLDNSKATASAFDASGFYHTGDRVYVKDNKLYIDGRIKETMKVNGWQVSPTELEATLLQHPHVADVAVTGITSINKEGLEITQPRAYVVKKQSGGTLDDPGTTEAGMKSFVAARLVSYKRLTGGVVFVDAIPRNPTGKILRRLLAAKEPCGNGHAS